jgi:hypothetical protein
MQTHVEYRVQTFENPIHYSILAPPAWILYKHQSRPADPLPEQSYYDGLTIVSNAITYVVNRPHNHESIDVPFSARRDILDAIIALTKPLPNGTSS